MTRDKRICDTPNDQWTRRETPYGYAFDLTSTLPGSSQHTIVQLRDGDNKLGSPLGRLFYALAVLSAAAATAAISAVDF